MLQRDCRGCPLIDRETARRTCVLSALHHFLELSRYLAHRRVKGAPSRASRDSLLRLVKVIGLFGLGAERRHHVAQSGKALVDETRLVDALRVFFGLGDPLTSRQVNQAEFGHQLFIVSFILLQVLGKQKCVDVFTFHVQLDLKNGVAT